MGGQECCPLVQAKRRADDEPEDAGAGPVPLNPSDPKTMQEALAKFGGSLRQGLPVGVDFAKAVLANTGELFLAASADGVVPNTVPLGQFGTAGQWLDGKALSDLVAKAKPGDPSPPNVASHCAEACRSFRRRPIPFLPPDGETNAAPQPPLLDFSDRPFPRHRFTVVRQLFGA